MKTQKTAVSFMAKMEDMAGMNDEGFEEFMDHYWRTLLKIMFAGIYVFMVGGLLAAVFASDFSLAAGWAILAAIISGGVLWSRWQYKQWPWIIS